MPTITVAQDARTVEYSAGGTLLDILTESNVLVDNPCNGKGTCGKCRVKVVEGNAGPITDTERRLLSQKDLDANIRLACMIEPAGDLTIGLLQKERKHKVLTEGRMPEFDYKLDIEKRPVFIEKPTLDMQTPFAEQICDQLGLPLDAISAHAISHVDFLPGDHTAVIHDGKVINVEPGDTCDALYGVAIDIGTTTVVCELVDMTTGKVLANASDVNAQKIYGLDVLTRITYETEHGEKGIANLQVAIVDSINGMIESACKDAGVDRSDIYEVAIGANCTMMHMLLGVDARPIGKAPFAPAFAHAQDLECAVIGIRAAQGARLYCLPHVSAYIGADIVAGAYVCQLHEEQDHVLFIDIGTNGEIVLASNGKLMSCSCAAGPALEGMNISAGMRAADGAIEEIKVTEEGTVYSIIGDAEPAGLCGSGILAVMRELLYTGIVRKNGAFVKMGAFGDDDYRSKYLIEQDDGKRAFVLTEQPERLLVTQGDVRQVQLAKGAILSGFMALLKKAKIEMGDLKKVIIAGQFGAHLTADCITGTGILPPELEERIEYAGNTSKTGAYMCLMSSDVKRAMEKLARDMDYMELGATENYERLFSDCLIFPAYKQGKVS